jgi:HD-GYP domain-containing protein (c-di-GMP phosphodiesterase class II)/Flp pilus assembly protein TadD
MQSVTALDTQNRLTQQAWQLLKIAEENLLKQPDIALQQVHYAIGLGSIDLQVRVKALVIQGEIELNQDRYIEASQTLQKALFQSVSGKYTKLELEIHMLLGKAFRRLGNLSQALIEFEESVELANKPHYLEIQASAYSWIASVQYAKGEYQKSLTYLHKAEKIQSQFDNQTQATKTIINIGLQYIELGEFPKALKNLFRALKLTQQNQNDKATEGTCLLNIGVTYQELGEYQRALEFYSKSLDIATSIGHAYMQCSVLCNFGTVHSKLEFHESALDLLNQALEIAQSQKFLQLETRVLDSLGLAFQATNNLDAAIEHHLKAIELAITIGDIECEIDARLNIGLEYLLLNDPNQARDHLEHALRLSLKVGRKKSIAKTHELLAQTYEALQQSNKTIFHLKQQLLSEQEIARERTDQQVQSLAAQLELERSRHENALYRLGNVAAKKAKEKAESEVFERTRQLEQAQLEMIERLSIAAEYRDDVTGNHAERVGEYCALIAQKLGSDSESVELLRQAARLHDIGKIGIPDSILLKPSTFTPEERGFMQTHTLIGQRILSGGTSKILQAAEQIAVTHHERWNGTGYPNGLDHENIPLFGRIVAVADVFDALMQARPYKPAWSKQQALEEIKRQSGLQFDPSVVEAALQIFEHLEHPNP